MSGRSPSAGVGAGRGCGERSAPPVTWRSKALKRCLYDTEFAQGCRERMVAVAERFTWPNVLRPLVEFCRDPRPAADRLPGGDHLAPSPPKSAAELVRRDLALVRSYLAEGGPSELARRVKGRVLKLARRGLRRG